MPLCRDEGLGVEGGNPAVAEEVSSEKLRV